MVPMKKNQTRGSRIIALTGSAVLALALTACSDGSAADGSTDVTTPAVGESKAYDLLPQAIKDSKVIKVAMTSTAPPYAYADPGSTTFKGMVPELAAEAEKHLGGVKLQIVDTPYPNQVPSLQSGKVDLVWGAIADTPEREKVLDLVDYMRSAAAPMVRQAEPLTITQNSDFCGHTVGTVKGGDLQTFLENQQKECRASGSTMKPMFYDSSAGATAALQAGQIDTLLGIDMLQREIARTAGDGKIFEMVDHKIVPTVYGVAFNPGQSELEAAMAEAIKQVMDSGAYDRIFKAYDAAEYQLTADEVVVNGVGSGAVKVG